MTGILDRMVRRTRGELGGGQPVVSARYAPRRAEPGADALRMERASELELTDAPGAAGAGEVLQFSDRTQRAGGRGTGRAAEGDVERLNAEAGPQILDPSNSS